MFFFFDDITTYKKNIFIYWYMNDDDDDEKDFYVDNIVSWKINLLFSYFSLNDNCFSIF